MNYKKTCQNCKFWSPVDPSLDNGWRMFGTCTKPTQYSTAFSQTRHRAGWNDDEMFDLLKKRLHEEQVLVQVSGPDHTDADRAYLRTSMDFGCVMFESKVSKPAEPSMTLKE